MISRRLVIPFDLRLPLQQGYRVVCPKAMADEPKVAVFLEWLLREANQRKPVCLATSSKRNSQQPAELIRREA